MPSDPLLADPVSRRELLRAIGAAGLLTGARRLSPDHASSPASASVAPPTSLLSGSRAFDLRIAETRVRIDGRAATATVWERRLGTAGTIARAAGANDRDLLLALGIRAWW